MPYHDESDLSPLAEMSINSGDLVVVLMQPEKNPKRISCRIWEHTIHELEVLSSSLLSLAEGALPSSFQVGRPDSRIGLTVNLSVALVCEVGFPLDAPDVNSAMFFCSSRDVGRRERKRSVIIGVAMMAGYGEIVVELSHAVEFAGWLDRQIEMLWQS